MQRPEIARLAGEIVPGTGAVRLEFLAGGLYHESFRVWRDEASYLLRLALEPAAGLAHRHWEMDLLKAAEQARLAPAIVHTDSARGLLLYRWVEGTFWSEAEIGEPARLMQVVALIHAIQALPLRAGCFMSPKDWVDTYREAAKRLPRQPSAELDALATQRLKSLGAPSATAVCHSDLHRFNLLEPTASSPPPGLVLLDWEYAHEADVYWDLAGWSANNDFGPTRRQQLLQAYLRRPATAAELLHLTSLVWLYDYVCLLWSELYLTSHPARGAERFAQRAALLEKRLR
jgi:aminoglycoside phosphotransferase (APT) family kinase protein